MCEVVAALCFVLEFDRPFTRPAKPAAKRTYFHGAQTREQWMEGEASPEVAESACAHSYYSVHKYKRTKVQKRR